MPQRVLDYDAELQSQGSDGAARGFIYKGKVYLLSDQLKSPQQIAEVLFHEVLGHYGLRGAFGAALDPILQQLGVARRKEVLAKAREYGMASKTLGDAQAWAAMSAKDRELAAEEVLAEMAQSHPELGFVKRAIAAIRNWLRVNVPGFKRLALTDADIIQKFILPARGFVTRSQETGEQSLERAMAAFSRDADSSSNIRFSRGGPPQPQPRFAIPEEGKIGAARRKLQDYFLRMQTVQREIAAQGGLVHEGNDVRLAEELSHGRKMDRMLKLREQHVDPMMQALGEAQLDLSELALYAYARHATERNARIASIDPAMPDGGSGMTNQEAQDVLDKFRTEGKGQALGQVHGQLMAIAQATRDLQLAEGLITQEHYDALQNAYGEYVPLRGFELMDADGKPSGLRAGRGFNVRGAETMRALGRKSRAGQVVENVIGDYQRALDRAERNRVAQTFLQLALDNPDPALWEVDATLTRKSLDRSTGRVARDIGIDKGEDTIAVRVKGHELFLKVRDPLLARALRHAHKEETGENERLLMRSVGLYTTLLRNTLTRYNPEFALVNGPRDYGFAMAAMLDEFGPDGTAKFMKHYQGAMAASHRSEKGTLDPARRDWDKWFLEYRAHGGMTAGWYNKDIEQLGADMEADIARVRLKSEPLAPGNAHLHALNLARKAGRVLEWAGAVSENAARVAAYRSARELGKTPAQAASIAKNLTTNFDRKGEMGQLVNSLYVFFNAAVQGSHRMARMLKNKRMWGYLSGLAGVGMALALLNAGAGGDDPDDGMAYWDKIPDYIKERNLIIMLPPGSQIQGAQEVGTKGRYIAIPMQYGLNVFHASGYLLADTLRNTQDPLRGKSPGRAAVQWLSTMAGAFNPWGGSVDVENGSSVAQAVLPSMFDPIIQLATGTNGFGRSVAPFKSPFDTKPDSQNANVRQAGGVAEKVAQGLNRATGGDEHESGGIDLSPGTVENLVRLATGGTGQFLMDTANLGLAAIERARGGAPDLEAGSIPLWRRVTGEVGAQANEGLFYERREQTQEAAGVVKRRGEAGLAPKDDRQATLAYLDKGSGAVSRELGQIRKRMKEVQRDTELTTQERREALQGLRAARDQRIDGYNRAFMEVMGEVMRKP